MSSARCLVSAIGDCFLVSSILAEKVLGLERRSIRKKRVVSRQYSVRSFRKERNDGRRFPLPDFLKVFILKVVEVLCFDTDL